jgi:hypothetical protein
VKKITGVSDTFVSIISCLREPEISSCKAINEAHHLTLKEMPDESTFYLGDKVLLCSPDWSQINGLPA